LAHHPDVFRWFKENNFDQIEVLKPSVAQIGVNRAVAVDVLSPRR
jgi:hypothetical protein